MHPLSNATANVKPDWARLLPPKVFFEVMMVLRAALPLPLIDEPGEWVRRDHAAMAAMGALATAAEARLVALPARTVAPKARAAGREPDYAQMSDGEIEALNTRLETAAGWPLTDALPGASGAGFGAEPHAG